jgi:methylmalonyl-CoA/ethylmalonyl-CoA epimerase
MLTGIHHVAYIVEDMDEHRQRFEALFDVEPTFRMRRDDEDFVLDAALYQTGDHYIEFISPISKSGWAYEYLTEHGEGFFHLGYEVDDLDAAIRSLREAGVSFVTDNPQAGVNDAWRLITLNEDETVVPTQLVQDDRTDRSTF